MRASSSARTNASPRPRATALGTRAAGGVPSRPPQHGARSRGSPVPPVPPAPSPPPSPAPPLVRADLHAGAGPCDVSAGVHAAVGGTDLPPVDVEVPLGRPGPGGPAGGRREDWRLVTGGKEQA